MHTCFAFYINNIHRLPYLHEKVGSPSLNTYPHIWPARPRPGVVPAYNTSIIHLIILVNRMSIHDRGIPVHSIYHNSLQPQLTLTPFLGPVSQNLQGTMPGTFKLHNIIITYCSPAHWAWTCLPRSPLLASSLPRLPFHNTPLRSARGTLILQLSFNQFFFHPCRNKLPFRNPILPWMIQMLFHLANASAKVAVNNIMIHSRTDSWFASMLCRRGS